MGKKNRRKAAKVASAAAGGGTSVGGCSNGQQLILGPRPDGVVCTNEDPNLCAVCSVLLPTGRDSRRFKICCGTKICAGCNVKDRCAYCKREAGQILSITKQRAKEGFPWAYHFWGDLYLRARCQKFCIDPKETYESFMFGLHEKAASLDHPISCLSLASFYALGVGCKENIEKARVTFDKAMRLHVEDVLHSDEAIFKVGHKITDALLRVGETEKGLAVFLPLAKRGSGEAQCMMSDFHSRVGDCEGAMYWATICADNPESAFAALSCTIKIGNLSLPRYWYGLASDNICDLGDLGDLANLKTAHQVLCLIRQECAWCHASLDRSTRKMCKSCKAHCYCSEDCQRAHWNAEENDHRSECQKVTEVKKKVAAMKK